MQPGDVIDGKFELVELLGESGMGMAFKARVRPTGEWVTIKVFFAHLAINKKSVDRLLREAKAANDIGSEYIARVVAVGQAEAGEPYVVREFLEGHDLAQLLAAEGPLPPDRAVALVHQAAHGLDLAHQRGIAHWNLKPGNILITRDPAGREQVSIVDFGVARFRDAVGADAAQATVSGAALGVGYYMPLEQARGAEDRDHRIDVYALGVILYELLTGRRPFDAESHSQVLLMIATTTPEPLTTLCPDLSPRLVKVVERAMAKDPNARYLSMADLCHALAALTDEELRAIETAPPPAAPLQHHQPPRELTSTKPDLPMPAVKRRRNAIDEQRRPSSQPEASSDPVAPRPTTWIWLVVTVLVLGALTAGTLLLLARPSSEPAAPPSEPTAGAAPVENETPDPRLHPEDRGFVDDRGGRGWSDRCFYHLMAERYPAARVACEQGLEIATDSEVRSSLLYNLGRVAQGEGNADEARRRYLESLELRPENPAVRTRLESLAPQ